MEKQFKIPNFINENYERKMKKNIKKEKNRKIIKILEVLMCILMILAGSSANLKTAVVLIPLFGLSAIAYNYFKEIENE